MKKIISFKNPLPETSSDYPKAERLVKGNPKRTTWNFYSTTGDELSCGIWASEAGAWRIVYPESLHEFFSVISGRIRLTDSEGVSSEFGAGEGCVIPGGFEGVFEVVEPARKYYALYSK